MEVDAGQLAYVDNQIGRVIDELKQSNELDNTMVIYIQGDNGASEEDYRGSNQELRVIAGIESTDAALARDIDKHGGPDAFGNYPAAWAWAINAPFQWGKRVASHLGGIRDGMVISWPDRIKDAGGIRSQFTHVIDVAPTIYEAAHVTPPKEVDGVKQQPIDGTSMVYSFDDKNAPSRHREQYFEMLGNRAYYKDGWIASTIPGRMPWGAGGNADPNKFKWALYDLNTDYSQSKDVSAQYPQKLAELQADFDKAAKKYHVYPLNADLGPSMAPQYRPSVLDNRSSYTYYAGDTRYSGYAFPSPGPGWTIEASLSISSSSASGPILVEGDHFGGQALVLDKGHPTFIFNPGDMNSVLKVQAPKALSAGQHEVAIVLGSAPPAKQGGLPGSIVDLEVDGTSVAKTQVSFGVRGRGDAYIGERGIAPIMDGVPRLPEKCDCKIDRVTLKRTP